MATARVPGRISLVDLVLADCLSESDVRPDGSVDEQVRALAERAFVTSRPVTAPPRRRALPRERITSCCVCFTRSREFAFEPCFHMCVCGPCAAKLTRCPMCRATIQRTMRIFL